MVSDDIVAATIHLDHLSQNEVRNILKTLQPYDNNMKVVTKKELSTTASLSSLALDLQETSEVNVIVQGNEKDWWILQWKQNNHNVLIVFDK